MTFDEWWESFPGRTDSNSKELFRDCWNAAREDSAVACEQEAERMAEESAARGLPFGELIPPGDEAIRVATESIRRRG